MLTAPGIEAQISRKPLGACINEHLPDGRIKDCARRAALLGNDEVHYSRRWEHQDIYDLKKLIALTVSWLANELPSAEYVKVMPLSGGGA